MRRRRHPIMADGGSGWNDDDDIAIDATGVAADGRPSSMTSIARRPHGNVVGDVDVVVAPYRRRQPRHSSSSVIRRRRLFYALHTFVILCVVLLGMFHNGGKRKYVPVNPGGLPEGSTSSCIGDGGGGGGRAYVNVHSLTMHEDRATIVCCSDTTTTMTSTMTTTKTTSGVIVENDLDTREEDDEWYITNLCHPRVPMVGLSVNDLPYANRLTRIFEAWFLPLLPILMHLAYHSMIRIRRIVADRSTAAHDAASGATTANAHSSYADISTIRSTVNRLLFYVLLLNLRGFGLYLGANAIEGYVVRTWHAMTMTKQPTNDDASSHHHCWYEDFLKAHHRRGGSTSISNVDHHHECYGRRFDFSDHVVLFIANYLVIFVAETLIIYSIVPLWHHPKQTTDTAIRVDGKGRRRTSHYSLSNDGGAMMWKIALASLFTYLHVLVCHALYRTAAYFHTPAEISVGYLVSMIVQLPVMYLMCSEGPHWAKALIGLQ